MGGSSSRAAADPLHRALRHNELMRQRITAEFEATHTLGRFPKCDCPAAFRSPARGGAAAVTGLNQLWSPCDTRYVASMSSYRTALLAAVEKNGASARAGRTEERGRNGARLAQ